jgi:hypothetical protein
MRRWPLIAISLLTFVLAPAAGARDRVITSDRTAANVSGFGQGLAWSREAADNRARLVIRAFAPPADLSVPPLAGGLFDPDLGQSAAGTNVIVYSRCSVSGRNCDVYEYDLFARRESKLPGASSARCSEFAPSIWLGTVAFARSGGGDCDGLFVKGTRGTALRLDRRVPADTDIRQGRVAYLHVPSPERTYIRLFTIRGGRSSIVAAGLRAEGERQRVTSPVFGGAYVYFLHHDLRRRQFSVGRSRARRAASVQFTTRSLPGTVASIAVDGGALFYSNGRGIFQATDPAPRFRAGG